MDANVSSTETLAITGISYRLPGDNDNDDSLWSLLKEGRDTWGKLPKHRYDQDAYHHPDPQHAGSIAAEGGFFMDRDPAAFDAPFFGISPAEASALDPQQRFLLETTYECFESAGVPMEKISGSKTGCFAGCFLHDYDTITSADIMKVPTYAAVGSAGSFLSNRVSWFYDLKGPSLTCDTACSSSLIAFHLACQSIWSGESDQALAVGANVILMPNAARSLTQMQFLSPDGRCYSFDDRGNGYGRGEGLVVLLIKPVSAAIRDGDCIRAVIRASASNQNGRTPGITMPSTEAQALLIRSAYESAGLDFDTTGYFEAHGTGTPIGDPLEFNAIAQTFAESTTRTSPLYVGSIKSNVGHLEGTAGLVGLLKAILCVEKGMIPPLANFQRPNPKLQLDNPKLQLATSIMEWPTSGIRRASVNSFGAGGSNAHVVIDDAASFLQAHGLAGFHRTVCDISATSSDSGFDSGELVDEELATLSRPKRAAPRLCVFSAPEQAGLQRMAARYAEYLSNKIEAGAVDEELDNFDTQDSLSEAADSQLSLDQLAHTLCTRRSVFDWKTFSIASSTMELRKGLQKGLPTFRKPEKTSGIAFVFSGQGAQAARMGIELLQYGVFRQHLLEADARLHDLGCPWSVIEELTRGESTSQVDSAVYAQPLCTIIQTALVDLLSYWGVTPKSVVGHSSGEIAAAYAAGHLSKQDAWKVAYYRGLYSASIGAAKPDRPGAMLAVSLSESEVNPYLAADADAEVVVACVNAPQSITLAGPKQSLVRIAARLEADNVFHSTLRVQNAYHSPEMLAVSKDYARSIADIRPLEGASRAVMFSSVLGGPVEASELGAEYWVENMLSKVQFTAAIGSLLVPTVKTRGRRKGKFDVNSFLEIGPHSALQSPMQQIIRHQEQKSVHDSHLSYNSVLVHGRDATEAALDAVGQLWVAGHPVDLAKVNQSGSTSQMLAPLTDLPPYPWNHSEKNRYWFEAPAAAMVRAPVEARHDLLGLLDDDNANTPRYRNTLRLEEQPWIAEHQVQGIVVLPGTTFIAMAIEAAVRSVTDGKVAERVELRDFIISRPLLFPDREKGIETRIQLQPRKLGTRLSSAPWTHVSVSSRSPMDASWNEHASCYFIIHYERKSSDVEGVSEQQREAKLYQERYCTLKQECTIKNSPSTVYLNLEDCGFDYGPLFKNLDELYCGPPNATGLIRIPDTASAMPKNYESDHVIHPIVLDNALQLVNPALRDCGLKSTTMLPTSVESIIVDLDIPNAPGSELKAFASCNVRGYHEMQCQIVVGAGDFTKPLVTFKNACFQEVAGIMDISLSNTERAKPIATELRWKEDIDLLSSTALRHVLTSGAHDLDEGLPEPHWCFAELVDLLSFKNPSLTILEMGCTGPDLAKRTIEHLTEPGQGARIDKYVISSPYAKPDWATECIRQHSGTVEYAKLDSTAAIDQDQEATLTTKFDAVVDLEDTIDIKNVASLVKTASTLLNSFGRLAFTLDSPAGGVEKVKHDIELILQREGFSGVDTGIETVHACVSRIFIVTTKVPETTPIMPQDILFVEPRQHNSKISCLMKRLEKELVVAGHKVSHATLDKMPDTEGTAVVSFLGLGESTLNQTSSEEFSALRSMLLRHAGLVWVSSDAVRSRKNPFRAMDTGLLRVIRSEEPALRLVQFDFSEDMDLFSCNAAELLLAATVPSLFPFNQEVTEVEVREQDGRLFIPRLFTEQAANDGIFYHTHWPVAQPLRIGDSKEALRLRVGTPGMLDTLCFTEADKLPTALEPGQVKVRVQATPINFVDIMVAMGMVPSPSLGCECAGVVEEAYPGGKFKVGDHVVVQTGNAFATHVVEHEDFIQPVPTGLTPAVAASCVTVFVTAYVALVDVARLRPGERVLIHAGAGGLGQAAIQLCQMLGATVYTTVGSAAKQQLLMDQYGIAEDHIFNSRDLTFAKGIMRQTGQAGVDVILNSTSGEALRHTWHCIAPFGRMIEVGKRDIMSNTGLDMEPFIRNATYSGVHIDQMSGPARQRVAVAMQKVFELLQMGRIHPVHPITVMTYSEMERAFRLVQTGSHTGKVVLTQSPEDIVPAIPPLFEKVKLKPDVTYAVAGGLGGLGQSMVDTMFDNGARNFAFFSRSGDSRPDAKDYLRNLIRRGAKAKAYRADIADLSALTAAVKQMEGDMPPVKGFVNAAMYLQDCLFATMSYEQWMTGIAPKVAGSWNFHNLLPSGMDFFISLSSISAMIGVPGHANYAAANTFQGALAWYRRSIGENALTIDLSAVFGTGVMEYTNVSRNAYYQSMAINEGELNTLLSFAMKGTTLKGVPCPTVLTTGVTPTQLNTPGLLWTFDPKLRMIRRLGSKHKAGMDDASDNSKLMDELQQCSNMPAVAKTIESSLVEKLSKSMACNPEDMNTSKPLHSFGVDSLVAVEMRNWIFKELKSEITVFDIMDPQPLSTLCYKIAERSKLISSEIKAMVQDKE